MLRPDYGNEAACVGAGSHWLRQPPVTASVPSLGHAGQQFVTWAEAAGFCPLQFEF